MGTRRPRRATAPGASRLPDIADAALACFIDRGYRLTQVADVAERTGFSVGAVYRYVEGKEALLYVAVLAAGGAAIEGRELPLRNPAPGEIAAGARQMLASRATWSLGASPGSGSAVRQIAADLFDRLQDGADLILLLDRCSSDLPEFARIFDDELRVPFLRDLVDWTREACGARPQAPELATIVRGAVEAVSWLAINRRRDRLGAAISVEEARNAAIDLFARVIPPTV